MKITTKVSSTVATFKNTDKICELIIRYCCYLNLIFALAYWVYLTDGEYQWDMQERAYEKHNGFLSSMVEFGGKILGEIDRIQRFTKATYGFDLTTLAHDRMIRFNDKIEETYEFYGCNIHATEYLAYILNSGAHSVIGAVYKDRFNADKMEFKFLKSIPEEYLESMIYFASVTQFMLDCKTDLIGYFVDSEFEYKSSLTDRKNMYRFVEDTIYDNFSDMTQSNNRYGSLPADVKQYIRVVFIKDILDLLSITDNNLDKLRVACEEILDYTKLEYVYIKPYKKRYPVEWDMDSVKSRINPSRVKNT